MLVDITQDIKEGKYDHPALSFFAKKLFGRRIFVKLNDIIVLGHLQYTFDHDKQVVIIYISFDFRKNKELRDGQFNLKIREYPFEDSMDLDRYVTEIRKEIIRSSPQTEGFIWSFSARELVV